MSQIIIFYSPLAKNASADELDVMDEVAFFQDALNLLGYTPINLAFPYNLIQLKQIITKFQPAFVVNLVETLFADGRLVHIGPFLFEHCGLQFTGCSAHAMYLSSHKILAKEYMKSKGILTPPFFTFQELKKQNKLLIDSYYLVKSVWEHASFGLHEDQKLLYNDKTELLECFSNKKHPENYFCEQYIHGREFNVSLIGGAEGALVLPVAEMYFDYPDDKPRILGYKAKWEEDSFEYKHTSRTFDFENQDKTLLDKLKSISLQCWEVFGLKGYARVDFRVDESGKIYVLEINANPCISAQSGFVAATQQTGLKNTEVVKRIMDDMMQIG